MAEDNNPKKEELNWEELDQELEKTAEMEAGSPEDLSKVFTEEEPEQPETKQHRERNRKHRKGPQGRRARKNDRKWRAREAEMDAMIDHRHYGFLGLLLHPCACMVNEYDEEIPSSVIASLFRMAVKWGIFVWFVMEKITQLVDDKAFSFMRISSKDMMQSGLRLFGYLMAAEFFLYIVYTVIGLFAHRSVSLKRVMAGSTMMWLPELIVYGLGAYIGMKESWIFGLLIMVFMFVCGILLRCYAFIEGTEMSGEPACIGTAAVLFVCAYALWYIVGMTETNLLQFLLHFYM